MAFYYLSFEPTQVKDLHNRYKYITMANTYKRGNPQKGKRYSSEENKQYNKMITNMKKSNEAFDSGEVDLHNNPIELECFINNLFSIPDFSKETVYRIEPIESKKTWKQYSRNSEHFWTNKFKVVNKITTLEDLVNQLHKDNLLDEFVGKYFAKTSYCNDGFKENNISFFEMINSKFKDYKPCLSHIMIVNINHYEKLPRFSSPSERVLELINHHLDNDLMSMRHKWNNDDFEVFAMLLRYKWFELAYKYLVEVETNSYDFGKMKTDKVVDVLIRLNSGDEFVKKIISHLGIEDTFVTLKIKQYDDDDYQDRIIETKVFKDIDELKTYLIKQYDVPFSDINKDINEIRGNDEYIRFEIE